MSLFQAEILGLIVDNLTVATPQTLSDPKLATPEEMEAKFVRTLATSLLAYAALLDAAVDKPDAHNPLLDSPKFWKLARQPSAAVRQAFYTAVSKLCQVLPSAVVSRGATVVPAILGVGLQEADVPAAAWGAALHLLAAFPAAWDHISHQKAVFPTVWKLLKTGGSGEGQAAQIYPNLMPFLSRIPQAVMGDSGKFLQRWFSSMFEGLQTEKVQRNPAECRAVVQAMVECLFYCLNKQDLEVDVKNSLVSDHLLELVKFSVVEGREKNCKLFHVLPDYLLYWDRNCSASPQIAHLNALFWSGLKYFCSTSEEVNRLELANAIIALAQALESKGGGPKESNSPRSIGEMMDILALIAGRAVMTLEADESSDLTVQDSVTILETVLTHFGQHDVILTKVCSSGGEMTCGSNSARLNLYRGKIAPLLQRPQQVCSEESLARLAWALARQAETAEAVAIVEEFVSATRPLVVNYIVPLALADKEAGGGREFLTSWLGRESILSLLTVIAESLALSMEETSSSKNKSSSSSSTDNNNWSILRTILGCGVAIPEVTVKQLVLVFLRGIQSVTRGGTKNAAGGGSAAKIVEFVCELFSVLVASGQADLSPGTPGLELVRLIFSLDAAATNFGPAVAAASRSKLESAWTMAVAKAGQPVAGVLCQDLSTALTKDLAEPDLDIVIDKARRLMRTVLHGKRDKGEVSSDIVNLVSLMLPAGSSDDEEHLSEQHLYRSVFSQKVYLSRLPAGLERSLLLQSEVELKHLASANRALLLLHVLAELLALDLANSSEDAEEVVLPSTVVGNERLMAALPKAIHAVVYLQASVAENISYGYSYEKIFLKHFHWICTRNGTKLVSI
jgi:hypothetical protein